LRNDDGAGNLNSRICVTNDAFGSFFLGSFSGTTEGSCRLDLQVHSFHGEPSE
jgi:hypothetical protein